MSNIEEHLSRVTEKIRGLEKFKLEVTSLQAILHKHEIYENVVYLYKPTKEYIFYTGLNFHMGNYTDVDALFMIVNPQKVYEQNGPNTISIKLDDLDEWIKNSLIVNNDITTALYRNLD